MFHGEKSIRLGRDLAQSESKERELFFFYDEIGAKSISLQPQ